MKNNNYRWLGLIVLSLFTFHLPPLQAQTDPIANGLAAVATVAGETKTPEDSVAVNDSIKEVPLWKKKLYYGYNFDIYFHHDSRSNRKENGWSIALEPELGWKVKERLYVGLRVGGSYANSLVTYDVSLPDTSYTTDLRVQYGSWNITPYVRYRLKSLFDGKLGIWLEGHVYTGMEFPKVTSGQIEGTDLYGLRHSVTYGLQISPVITYQFNRKSTFQVFFSILSFGYSGTTFFYSDPEYGSHREYTNDIIIFSGKLRNLIANQFTPGLYGLKFGIQKNF